MRVFNPAAEYKHAFVLHRADEILKRPFLRKAQMLPKQARGFFRIASNLYAAYFRTGGQHLAAERVHDVKESIEVFLHAFADEFLVRL